MQDNEYSVAFDAARQALREGQAPQAKALAAEVLSWAKAAGDLQAQARALHLLGRIEHQSANLRSALSLARQAAQLFHVLNTPRDESIALSHSAHLASLLGLTEEAVESATLSVQLADSLPPDGHTVDAYNYLGVAATWVDVAHADRVLCKAIALAEHSPTPQAAARPMVNRLINELYRLELCLQRGLPADVQPAMLQHLARYTEFVEVLTETGDWSVPGSSALLQTTMQAARAGLLSFAGHRAPALEEANRISFDSVPVWIHSLLYVVQARCQLAAGHWDAALVTTHQALNIAERLGQPNFVLMSRYQRMEAYETKGDADRLMAEFRAFRVEQIRQQTEVIVSRERVAALRLAWREQTRTLEAMHSSARALERLTLEDHLTGLANRRQLEHTLDDLLSGPTGQTLAPWCLVMIDIDGFKQINDQFSHVLGDKVLRQVANVLRDFVRQQDLAVRLAGDEFVLILRETSEAIGWQVVERLNHAIDQFPWTAMQPGLHVHVSLGLAQARPGDTCESLLRRSDLRMYANKSVKTASALHRPVTAE